MLPLQEGELIHKACKPAWTVAADACSSVEVSKAGPVLIPLLCWLAGWVHPHLPQHLAVSAGSPTDGWTDFSGAPAPLEAVLGKNLDALY